MDTFDVKLYHVHDEQNPSVGSSANCAASATPSNVLGLEINKRKYGVFTKSLPVSFCMS